MEKIVVDILSTIFGTLILIAMGLYLIYIAIYVIKTDKLRQDHIKTLNEHDKSVIMDYKNTFWSIKKHDSNNNPNGN